MMYHYDVKKKFAWWPQKLTSGRWLWLRMYYSRVVFSAPIINLPLAVDNIYCKYEYYSKDDYLVLKLKDEYTIGY